MFKKASLPIWVEWSALVLVLVALLVWRFAFATVQSAGWIHDHAYYSILTLSSAVFVLACLRMARAHDWVGGLWRNRMEVMQVLAVTGLVLWVWSVHEPAMERVCQDEPQHMSSAFLMHESAKLGQPNFTFGEGDMVYTTLVGPVFRGALYPYLVSLWHDVFGYSEVNAFRVNLVLGAVVLLQCYGFGRVVGGCRAVGWLAFLLMSSVPLLGQVARSGSYDLLNVVLLFLYVASLRLSWRNCGPAELLYSASIGVLLALTRAESIVYLGLLAAMLLFMAYRGRSVSMPRSFWLLIPGVVAALATQVVMVYFYPRFSDSMNTTGKPNLAWSNLVLHGEDAIAYLFAFDDTSTASALLAWFGVVSALLCLALLITRRMAFAVDYFILYAASVVVILFYSVTLATFWGGPSQPEMARFTLPLWICFIWAVVLCARDVLWVKSRVPYAVALSLVALFVFTLPSIRVHKATKSMGSAWINQSMSRLGDRMKIPGTLFVAQSNLVYANKRVSSCTAYLCTMQPEKIALMKQYGLIRRVLLFVPMSEEPQMDTMVRGAFGRPDMSKWKLRRIDAEPILTLPRCEAVCFEVEGIQNQAGQWVMFDGPSLNFPKFEATGAYDRFILSLMPR